MNGIWKRKKTITNAWCADVAGMPVRNYKNGDVTYYTGGPSFAVFFAKEGRSSQENLIRIGKVISDLSLFQQIENEVKVKINVKIIDCHYKELNINFKGGHIMSTNKKDVVVLVGAGSIGQAIARRIGAGRHVVLADLHPENADAAAKILLDAGFEVSKIAVDISSRESIRKLIEHAQEFGPITNLINAAGVSPSQAPVSVILKVDLYGTAVLLEEFSKVIADGGSGIIISSQSGHRLGALSETENMQLATTSTEELLELPFIKNITDTLKAYQYSKRCNVLRVMYEATRWGKRDATINSISPGVIITPLANDELNGPRGEGYRKMLSLCPAGRAGTPDEVGELAEFLMSKRGRFITGSDYLIDGGTTASYWYGDLQYLKETH